MKKDNNDQNEKFGGNKKEFEGKKEEKKKSCWNCYKIFLREEGYLDTKLDKVIFNYLLPELLPKGVFSEVLS